MMDTMFLEVFTKWKQNNLYIIQSKVFHWILILDEEKKYISWFICKAEILNKPWSPILKSNTPFNPRRKIFALIHEPSNGYISSKKQSEFANQTDVPTLSYPTFLNYNSDS